MAPKKTKTYIPPAIAEMFQYTPQISTLELALSALNSQYAKYSRWKMYEILSGRMAYEEPLTATIKETIEKSLLEDFNKNYNSKSGYTPESILAPSVLVHPPTIPATDMEKEIIPTPVTTPQINITPQYILTDTGMLSQFPPNTPLILDLPSRSVLDNTYIRFRNIDVPFKTRVKAQLAMMAANSISETPIKKAIVWIVADTGEISTFVNVEYDEDLCDAIRRTIAELLKMVAEKQEPDPGSDDENKRICLSIDERIRSGQTRNVLVLNPEIEEHKQYIALFKNYRERKEELSKINPLHNEKSEEFDVAKRQINALFRTYDQITLPNGEAFSPTIVNVGPQKKDGYSFVKLHETNLPSA